MLKEPIKEAIDVMSFPGKSFGKASKVSFEKSLGNHMLRVLIAGFSGLGFNLLFGLIRALYFQIFFSADVNYWNVVNYSLGMGISIFFFFVFAGSFILFAVALLLRPFNRKLKFIEHIKIVIMSSSPVVLLGWIPALAPSAGIWSLLLFFIGKKDYS